MVDLTGTSLGTCIVGLGFGSSAIPSVTWGQSHVSSHLQNKRAHQEPPVRMIWSLAAHTFGPGARVSSGGC